MFLEKNMKNNYSAKISMFFFLLLSIFLTSCGFRFQGDMPLAPPLHRLYLQTPEPYGYLARNLRQYLKLSHIELVASPAEADTILAILQDTPSETFLSVNGTQQTRQYNLSVTVVFDISDTKGQVIVPAQTLTEIRTITVQSSQILGNSNEANLYYQQMRRTLAYSIMFRIASRDVTERLMNAFHPGASQTKP